MLKHSPREIALAIGSSALAGYVDAIGFLSLGGFFVSFMSGNSTRLAVGIAGVPDAAVVAVRIIAAFVIGVVIGSLVGRAAGMRRRPAVLALVSVVLASSAALASSGLLDIAMVVAAAAMGAENAIFERDGEVSIGLTYMTGTLVKFGQRIAAAITGGSRTAWLPYALLWLGLVLGAIAGATAYSTFGAAALWAGAAYALLLSIWALIVAT